MNLTTEQTQLLLNEMQAMLDKKGKVEVKELMKIADEHKMPLQEHILVCFLKNTLPRYAIKL